MKQENKAKKAAAWLLSLVVTVTAAPLGAAPAAYAEPQDAAASENAMTASQDVADDTVTAAGMSDEAAPLADAGSVTEAAVLEAADSATEAADSAITEDAVEAVLLTAAEIESQAAVFTAAQASFENNGDGADQIALTESRTFTAKIPVTSAQAEAISGAGVKTVSWSLDRDTGKEYVSAEMFPNQTDGGALTEWKTTKPRKGDAQPFFKDVETTLTQAGVQDYLCVTFTNNCYFNSDPSAPHNEGGAYLDVCGYFNLTPAVTGVTDLGSVPVKIAPYDSFHTMAEVYEELEEMTRYAKTNTNLFVAWESMGKSSGVLYDALEMPYLIVAQDAQDVADWLAFTEEAETNPTAVLEELAKGASGAYANLKVPVMYSNIHANEVAATDGVMNFAWMLLKSADTSNGVDMSYKKLTDFTTSGQAILDAQHGTPGEEGSLAVPDLVKDKATFLGAAKTQRNSGVEKIDELYKSEQVTISAADLLDDVFFILVPEENVEGRTYITRESSNGYDLNRDNSFQTMPETANMQKLIGTYNPVSLMEFHGRVKGFQVEPCDPPHEPNFEYDLLAKHLVTGGEAFGSAAVANNDGYNSYVMPQRDYLEYTGNKTKDGKDETYWADPWDDMSTSYTPQFAMLHGTVAYTVELPAYNDDAAQAVQYGCLGQSVYIGQEKFEYLKAQTENFERGVKNFNSDAYDWVGQWFCDQYDVEGAESELFRPEYKGEGQNGNFYPECYIIPLDGKNQKNLQGAYDMMEWLTRNDVKVQVTTGDFTYQDVTYPAGTLIVPMYQAKRSVANGALYDGTLIQDWTVLYSEGITSFAETRGFDMATVAEPAAYTEIKAVCSGMMNHDAAQSYLAGKGSYLDSTLDPSTSGTAIVISNVSEDSTAAVNTLLKGGKQVGMVMNKKSPYYGDFLCSYADYQTVSGDYVLSATVVSAGGVTASAITKSPKIYVAGTEDVNASDNTSGFKYANRIGWGNYSWNYDRKAMEILEFETVKNVADADVIVGSAYLSEAELAAIQSGKPYLGYGGVVGYYSMDALLGDTAVRGGTSGMDCLGYVKYPTTSLINGSFVQDGDDVMYGYDDYGVGFFSKVPSGAKVLVQMDGSKQPTEGFIPAITAEQKSASKALMNNSILGFSYEGKDVNGNDIDVALFANSLTHKAHQRDDYGYISNFIFSNLLADKEADEPQQSSGGKHHSSGGGSGAGSPVAVAPAATGSAVTTSGGAISGEQPGTPAGSAAAKYTDVKDGTWYTAGVDYVVSKGIMTGYSSAAFGVGDPMTREQLVTVLYRLAKMTDAEKAAAADAPSALNFGDIKDGKWYSEAILWATEKEVVKGYSSTVFGLGDVITREQLVTILYRYASLMGTNVNANGGAEDALSAYSDAQEISAYAKDAFSWAVANGLVNGTGDGKLSPQTQLSREQFASIIQRFCEK